MSQAKTIEIKMKLQQVITIMYLQMTKGGNMNHINWTSSSVHFAP
jgi:hypothetical protein